MRKIKVLEMKTKTLRAVLNVLGVHLCFPSLNNEAPYLDPYCLSCNVQCSM